MSVTPNIQGFADAQRRLRQELGQVVTFYTPTQPIWDPDMSPEAFDPETGLPYDVTIQPLASGYVTASARCSIAFNSIVRTGLGMGSDALGLHSDKAMQLIVDPSDLSAASGASFYELNDDRWTIVDIKADGIGALQRYIVYGQDDT